MRNTFRYATDKTSAIIAQNTLLVCRMSMLPLTFLILEGNLLKIFTPD
jgi:hypothetical protein